MIDLLAFFQELAADRLALWSVIINRVRPEVIVGALAGFFVSAQIVIWFDEKLSRHQ